MNKFFIFSVSTPDQILYDIEELANVTEDYIGPELTHLYEVRVYNGPWGLDGCVYLCIQWYVQPSWAFNINQVISIQKINVMTMSLTIQHFLPRMCMKRCCLLQRLTKQTQDVDSMWFTVDPTL